MSGLLLNDNLAILIANIAAAGLLISVCGLAGGWLLRKNEPATLDDRNQDGPPSRPYGAGSKR